MKIDPIRVPHARMGEIIHVGTSSWSDPGFVEEWYPEGLAPRDRLPYYAERFDAVEVNSTFYAVPQQHQVARGAEITPAGFTFDVKLHRLLSRHSAQLDSLPKPLRERAQTGPRGRVELDARLEDALADAVFEAHGAVWVGVDAPRGNQVTIMPPVDAVTHPAVAYIRAHGRNAEGYVRGRSVAERFAYRYPDKELEEIGARAQELAGRAEQVRLHFNNNRGSDAPVAAERMRELLGQTVAASGGA